MQLHSAAGKRDMFEDPLFWVFVLPGVLLGAYAQSRIKMNVAKYSRVTTDGGITGPKWRAGCWTHKASRTSPLTRHQGC